MTHTAAENLRIALEDALHYHQQLEPAKPTTDDQAPMKLRHLWEERVAQLRTMLWDLEEKGERLYAHD